MTKQTIVFKAMTILFGCVAAFFARPSAVWALGGFDFPTARTFSPDQIEASGSIRINDLRRNSKFLGYGLGSPLTEFNFQAEEIDRAVYRLLRDRGLPSELGLRTLKDSTHKNGTREVRFDFKFGQFRLCGYGVKAYVVNGRLSMVSGRFPDRSLSGLPSAGDWIEPQLAAEQAMAETGDGLVTLSSKDRCLYEINTELVPVWDMVVIKNDLPYRVLAGEYETFLMERRYFDATAVVKGWEKNRLDAKLKNYEVDIADGQTFLSNSFFVSSPAGDVARASSDNLEFDFDIDTDEFVESTSFAFANETLSWFESFGYSWTGPKPMALKIHFDFGGVNRENNALYQPETGPGDVPEIRIGRGDGKVLQYLIEDVDVISHEFGHHVVFDYVTSTSGESLAMHEGLSDFFAFQKTDDACLGESICPAGSGACYVADSCLRSGETSISYIDSSYKGLQGHIQGQLISGWLWDIHKYYSVPKDDVTRIAMGALKFLSRAADFADLADGLLQSADELGGEYNCEVGRAAIGRGLNSELPSSYDYDSCAAELGPVDVSTEQNSGSGAIDNGAGGGSSKKSSGGGGLFCAVNPLANGNGSPWPLVFVFLLPVTLPLSRRILG